MADRRPLLLLLVAPALARAHRVIVPNLPGHGGSAPLSSARDLDPFAESLLTVVEAEEALPAVWVGHSLGGLYYAPTLAVHYAQAFVPSLYTFAQQSIRKAISGYDVEDSLDYLPPSISRIESDPPSISLMLMVFAAQVFYSQKKNDLPRVFLMDARRLSEIKQGITRKDKGLGIGTKAGSVKPDGIELKVIALAMNEPPKKELDESGEDYLYPTDLFRRVSLPADLQRALRFAS